jgi:radical SAM protein with 4Fe4S-binding SPASM domain
MRGHLWPKAAVWETTLRCNMRCLHCGSVAGEARSNELNTEEALNLAQQLIDMGIEIVILSGGETLMREDWDQIAEYLISAGVRVGIITNGVIIDQRENAMTRFKELHAMSDNTLTLGLSLDGLEQTHDRIRGINGSFRQVLRIIQRGVNVGLPVVVLTTVNNQNIHELPELRELIFSLEPYAWQFQVCNAYGRMNDRRSWLLNEEEYVCLVNFLAESRKQRRELPRIDCSDCIGYFTELEPYLRDTTWSGCQAGIRSIGIEADGTIKGCLSLLDERFREGNIREQSLAEIWDRKGAFDYNRQFDPSRLEGMCADCEYGLRCGAGCTGVAHSITGSTYRAPYCVYGLSKLEQQAKVEEPASNG